MPPRAAVCLFGAPVRFAGRSDLTLHARNARLTRLAVDSLQQHVLAANPHVAFDVYWVGTAAAAPALLSEALPARNGSEERVFRWVPRFRAVGWPARPASSSGMFLSIEAVMALRAASPRPVDHDLVLLARLDAVWLSPLDLALEVAPGAVYMAHWCAAEAVVGDYDADGWQCAYLRSRPFESVAPDFYFLGRTPVMARVFDALLVDYLGGAFAPTYAGSENHKIVTGRLRNRSVVERRRLYHHFDIAVPRKGTFDPEQPNCTPRWIEPPARDGRPLCDAEAMVCTCGWTPAWRGGAWPRVQ